VAMIPTATTSKLTLCCVVRTAFSPGERSDHLTWPVSPERVILLRCGCGGVDGWGVELCAARARARRADAGWMRGRRKDGRSRAMASTGLYIAAMVAGPAVNGAARAAAWRGAVKVKARRCDAMRCGRRGPRHRGTCGPHACSVGSCHVWRCEHLGLGRPTHCCCHCRVD
jgi:hypothetical protein